jgi:hypothetical protein
MWLQMKIEYDVITFHIYDVYGQHIQLYQLTNHIKLTTNDHYLQQCYNPLQSAMWHKNFHVAC